MLQIQKIRDEKEAVIAGLQKKNFTDIHLVDELLTIDENKRKTQAENDNLLAQLNKASKEIGMLMGQGKKEEAETKKEKLAL